MTMHAHPKPNSYRAIAELVLPMWQGGQTIEDIAYEVGYEPWRMQEVLEKLRDLKYIGERPRARRKQKTLRPCMCCRTPFKSEGIGNRLCVRCRHRSEAFDL